MRRVLQHRWHPFNPRSRIAAHEPVPAFDYNANGRIDFNDVVWLVTHL